VVVGEILWDRFQDRVRLGGAPLNLSVHLARLGHQPMLVSAVGTDAAGEEARSAIAALGLDTTFIQSTARFRTGSAVVHLGPDEQTSFTIERPAAYDAVELTDASIRRIVSRDASWLSYGTLFPSSANGSGVLRQLFDAVPRATRFYDLNLRPGFESPVLVDELMRRADVVKLNERELRFVHEHLGLPQHPEQFCRAGSERYGWVAACVTLGPAGCAMLVGDQYVDAPGVRVDVADPVGAGDAFAAAFIHGIVSNWPVARVASAANRIGAFVAGQPGAIPDGSPDGALRA
jgi:fructokinase